jgi:hypothetical protein
MQIEWGQGEVLKLAGVCTEAEEGAAEVRQLESMIEDVVKERVEKESDQE